MYDNILKDAPNFENNELYRNVICHITDDIKRHSCIMKRFQKELDEHNNRWEQIQKDFDEISIKPILYEVDEKNITISEICQRITILKSIRNTLIHSYNDFTVYAYRERWNFDGFDINEFRRFEF
jgi:hypothetical protein